MGRSSDLPNFQSLSKEEFENVIKTSVQNGSVTTREIGRTITTRVYAVPFSTGNGLYYALLEHQSIESFDPEVRGPRTTIDRYRLALVVPQGCDLKTAIDLLLAPQAMVNAQKVEGTLEFALHMVPFGAAADYTCQGDLPNAGWSIAGDIAGVLTFGAGKVLRVSSKSYELSKRGLVGGLALEGSIGIYRTGEGTYLLSQGEGGQGEIAEGLLRLFGVSASLMRGKGNVALEKVLDDAAVNGADDYIIPGQKWYHGTDVISADNIARNGLNRKKLMGSNPIEGNDTPGFFVTDRFSDAQDYARLRSAERGLNQPGTILEWDDTEIGRFLQGVGKDSEAIIPFNIFDKVPRPRQAGGG